MRNSMFGHRLRHLWRLDEETTFLNHGSFGATPVSVLEAQDRWRQKMERQPVQFLVRDLPDLIRDAAGRLAEFLGSSGDDLVFVDNATTGVNTVLNSVDFNEGDEILLTNHGYPAVAKAVTHLSRRLGVCVVETQIPFPVGSDESTVEAVAQSISPRTRLVILDHISSPTALVFPIKKLVEVCHEHNTLVLIDGAHGPGMFPVDLEDIGADYYTGNCHKWLMAPKGCGFLWTQKKSSSNIHPLVISHGLDQGYTAEFDWTGTRDPSAFLAVTAALSFLGEFGCHNVFEHNHSLVIHAGALLAETLGREVPGVASSFGTMIPIPLPDTQGMSQAHGDAIHDRLIDKHNIEVPIMSFANQLWVRVSAQIYNEMSDYERLADVLVAEKRAFYYMNEPG